MRVIADDAFVNIAFAGERVENFSSFHAKCGKSFIDEILNNSFSIEQEFVILKEELKSQS